MCRAHQSFKVGIDVISDGMRVQPNAAELYLARGVLYVQLADCQSAEADFEHAHELDPTQSLKPPLRAWPHSSVGESKRNYDAGLDASRPELKLSASSALSISAI